MQNKIKEQLMALAERIAQTKGKIQSEEATKTAYIMPFLQIMGYDIFNPEEVVPEFTADIGIKANEKVDYALILNGKPEILIECKKCTHDLNAENESQLLRYYNVTQAEFGILTNGIQYKFYTDTQSTSQMDTEPFFSIDLAQDIDTIEFAELSKFHRDNFSVENIRKTAKLLKSSGAIKREILAEFANPSKEWVTLIFKRINPESIFTPAQRETFTPLVKNAIEQIINDRIHERLNMAELETEKVRNSASEMREAMTDKIVTTDEEKEAFSLIRSFAAEINLSDRVFMRDAQTYCAILFDDNNRRPIIRFYFNNPNKKYVWIFEPEEKVPVTAPLDILPLKKHIQDTMLKYYQNGKK